MEKKPLGSAQRRINPIWTGGAKMGHCQVSSTAQKRLNQSSPNFMNLTLTDPAFSVVCQAWGVLKGPDAKSHGYHKLIEIKFCVS